eukprot:TRINITY_DN10882_c3_g1_i1.p1 TRINITY_DN10882_c3_g1~~TRINITY_DN10882_c3_g1_i1.p1  ORF type:complete len:768 (+),score=239.60 TRINITY_DN10882_c3_g1_i1:93-2396(+)
MAQQGRVVPQTGAVLRAGEDTASAKVGTLPQGTLVTVGQVVGRRAYLTSHNAWASLSTADGTTVIALSPPAVPAAAAPAPAAGGGEFRARLLRYYQKYAPDRVGNMDNLLAQYQGREEELMSQLVGRYGPEPPAPGQAAAPPAAPPPGGDFRARLLRYYQRYAPDQVGNMDGLLSQWQGREEELMAELVKSYGPEPPAPAGGGAAAVPAAAAAVPAAGAAAPAAGAAPGAEPFRARMLRYYQRYAPDQVGNMDGLLAQWQGREEELMAELVKTYGPEPPAPVQPQQGSVLAQMQAAGAGAAAPDHRQKLVAFYQHAQPDKVAIVDDILALYQGRELTMFDELGDHYPLHRGWGRAYDALRDFYTLKDPTKIGNVAELLFQWHGGQNITATTPVPPGPCGHYTEIYATVDGLYQAQYMGARLQVYNILAEKDPGRQYQLMPGIHAVLAASSGSEQTVALRLRSEYDAPPAAAQTSQVAAPAEAPAEAPAPPPPPPPPPLPRGQAVAPAEVPPRRADAGSVRRVRRYVAHRLPERAEGLDGLLSDWRGRERRLLDKLVREHGPEPPPSPRHEIRLRRFYRQYAPEKEEAAAEVLREWAGREEELVEALAAKYGDEPSAEADEEEAEAFVARVRHWYEQHAPEKLGTEDSVVRRWAGREKDLLHALAAKYGGPAAGAEQLTLEQRVQRMYDHYAPGQPELAERALQKFSGRLADLLDGLVAKYGPEPVEAGAEAAADAGSAPRQRLPPFRVPPPREPLDYAALIAWCEGP